MVVKETDMDLRGRDFLKLLDYTPEEITYLLDLAAELKDKKKKGIPVDHHRGRIPEDDRREGHKHLTQ